jgi:hypothetical protein
MELSKRILRNIRLADDTFCWIWRRSGSGKGYGKIKVAGKLQLVHRLAYEVFRDRSEITGKQIHHECLNRGCANPWHMKPVTYAEHAAAHGGHLGTPAADSSPEALEVRKERDRERERAYRARSRALYPDKWREKRRAQRARYRQRQREAGLMGEAPVKSPAPEAVKRREYKRRYREEHPEKWQAARRAQKARYQARLKEKKLLGAAA